MASKDSKRIVRTYNRVAKALIEFETLWTQAWIRSIESAKAGLQSTLIVRHPTTGNTSQLLLLACDLCCGSLGVPSKSYHCQPLLSTHFLDVDLVYANGGLLTPQLCLTVLPDAHLIRATGLSGSAIHVHHRPAGELLVNFDKALMQLIRETKYLQRMGIAVPESARQVLAQEEKFKIYFNQLTYAVKVHTTLWSDLAVCKFVWCACTTTQC